MNKNYIKGKNKEHQIVNYFKFLGYQAVRSAGSHSQVDVFAFKNNLIIFLQIKSTKKNIDINKVEQIYKKEIKEFQNLEVPFNVIKQFWIKPNYKPWIVYDVNTKKVEEKEWILSSSQK